jgi:hypothetical protein
LQVNSTISQTHAQTQRQKRTHTHTHTHAHTKPGKTDRKTDTRSLLAVPRFVTPLLHTYTERHRQREKDRLVEKTEGQMLLLNVLAV